MEQEPKQEGSFLNAFYAHVQTKPNAIALLYHNEQITYDELNRQASQFAEFLITLGAHPNKPVILGLDRTPATIVAILGVIKAGAAYLPLDLTDPLARIQYILDDAQADIFIAPREWYHRAQNQLHFKGKSLITLNEQESFFDNVIGYKNLETKHIQFDDLVYCIYTSGSMGKPKGVMVTHGALGYYLNWFKALFDDPADLRVDFSSAISFDMTVSTTLGSLAMGATMVICDQAIKADPESYLNYLQENEISLIKTTPTYLKFLLDYPDKIRELTALKWIVLGGESVNKKLLLDWLTLHPQAIFVNEYGPTEATVGVMRALIDLNNIKQLDVISMGKPAPYVKAFVLNKQRQICKNNEAGELYLAGPSLAAGFWRDDKLTTDYFLNYLVDGQIPIRLYKTGDMVRQNQEGDFFFLGRNDEQIKVDGHRVELEEIRKTAEKYVAPLQSLALSFQDDHGKNYVTLYLVGDNGLNFDLDRLRYRLAKELPYYMLPKLYIFIESLPTLNNGKINKAALEGLTHQSASKGINDYLPSNETEEKVLALWGRVLGISVKQISMRSSFFVLGGNSLTALKIINHLNEMFSISMRLSDFLACPTIKKLSERVSLLLSKKSLESAQNIASFSQSDVPISLNQRRWWLLSEMYLNHYFSHVPKKFVFTGDVHVECLVRAIEKIIERHTILRTIFPLYNQEIYQKVLPASEGKSAIHHMKFSEASEKEIDSIICQFIRKPFNLQQEIPIRALLINVSVTKVFLVISKHHIITDSTSEVIFDRELSALYNAYSAGNADPLPPLPVQYSHFTLWQYHHFSKDILDKQSQYWVKKLKDLSLLNLPHDFVDPEKKTFTGKRKRFVLPIKILNALQKLSYQEEATIFVILLSVFNVLLSKHAVQDDIAIGVPIINRPHSAVENLIGFFANTLVLRHDLSNNPSFLQLIERTKEVVGEALSHQDVPFNELVQILSPERQALKNPLFQVMFTFNPCREKAPVFNNVNAEISPVEINISMFDLQLFAEVDKAAIHCAFEYNSDLFLDSTIDVFITHFCTILNTVLKQPVLRLDEISMLDFNEHALIHSFNYTSNTALVEKSLYQLFLDQVAQNPGAIALQFKDDFLSFSELRKQVDYFSHVWFESELQNKNICALFLNRSPEFIVAMLVLLKLGITFLPIDPEVPDERVVFYLKQAGIDTVITSVDLADRVPSSIAQPIFINNLKEEIPSDFIKENTGIFLRPKKNPIYVIYTSGSTGEPKGAVNTAQGVLNRIVWMKEYFRVTKEDVVLQKTAVSFDVSMWELLLPLVSGAKMLIAEGDKYRSPEYLKELFSERGITIAHFLPSMLSQFLASLPCDFKSSVKHVICSGEVLDRNLRDEFYQSFSEDAALYNLYGPTEAAIDVTVWKCDKNNKSASVPIGKPISNIQLYVLDKKMQIVPIGIMGELYIAGLGVACGYINNQKLTEECFVANPFSSAGDKLYKTGDLVRWLPTGDLEFIGRNDDQVKIRGQRLELSEIEAAIRHFDQIAGSIVLYFDFFGGGEKELVAYLKAKECFKAAFDIEGLRFYLKRFLPSYMIPSKFILLDKFPLLPTGKVDTKALMREKDFLAKKLPDKVLTEITPTQEKLRLLWKDLLHHDKFSVHDDFFDLGGHSLMAIKLINKIHSLFLRTITYAEFLGHSTIEKLEKLLEADNTILKGSSINPNFGDKL